LKKIVAREPREEVLEQLDLFEGKIKEYRKQIKLMEADLAAERTKYESQKWERNGIADDMNELKSRYFEHKKKETEDEELKNAG